MSFGAILAAVRAKGGGGAQYPNLILNPGFETPGAGGADVFDSWSEYAYLTSTIARDTSVFHSGAASCKLTFDTGYSYVYQDLTVVPERQYRLTFWCRGDGSFTHPEYMIYNNTNAGNIVGLTDILITDTTWTIVTNTFTVPAGCISVGIYLQQFPYPGSVYFDDVKLEGPLAPT
jgi:hypothetical protein